MNEPFSEELLSAYFDDELSSEQRAEVEKHLHESPAAQSQLADFGRISEAIKSLPQEPAPIELSSAVLKEAERQSLLPSAAPIAPSQPRLQTVLKSTAWGMVTLTAGFFLIVGLFNQFSDDQSPLLMSSTETENESLAFNFEELAVSTPAPDAKQPFADKLGGGLGGGAQPFEAVKMDAKVGRSAAGVSFGSITNGIPALAAPTNSNLSFSNATTDLTKVEIGDVIPYLEMSEDRAAFIEVTVVDIQQALGTMQFLLAKNSIHSSEELDESQYRKNNTSQDMFAVYVEAEGSQLLAAIEEMKSQHQDLFLGLNLKGPVDVSELSESIKTLDGLSIADQESRDFTKGRFSRASSAVRKALKQTPVLTEEKNVLADKPMARSLNSDTKNSDTKRSLAKSIKSTNKKESPNQSRNPTAPPPPLPTPEFETPNSQAFQIVVQIPNKRQLAHQKNTLLREKNAPRGKAEEKKGGKDKTQLAKKPMTGFKSTGKSVRVIFLLQIPASRPELPKSKLPKP